jgi:hypothetical protein
MERIDHGGRTASRVTGTPRGTRSDPTDDAEVEAAVGRFGFVHRLEVAYPSGGSFGVGTEARVIITIRMRYTDLGNTTVAPPEWIPPANATGATEDRNRTIAAAPRVGRTG